MTCTGFSVEAQQALGVRCGYCAACVARKKKKMNQQVFYIREAGSERRFLLARENVVETETYGVAVTSRWTDAAKFPNEEDARKELAELPDYGKWEVASFPSDGEAVYTKGIHTEGLPPEPVPPSMVTLRLSDVSALLTRAAYLFEHAMMPGAPNRSIAQRQALDTMDAAKKDIEAITLRAELEFNGAIGLPK